ncbi:hypothetical protein B0J12DRAFT_722532 [Macrophomina phaseolina]|uniref:Major facilitator superfamily (MFS) profile domain-containing protein n=1 Tax=Macrophomina phaseolina TaxID=35725 RepID=A0ABQ8FR59_9PEZI|nr:hypothetical protein B0J12DRAFT_722532 [Macrophomina phaseolina]
MPLLHCSDVAAAIDSSAFELFWIGSSFLLAATVMILQVGSVSHIFGRPPVYTFCLTNIIVTDIVPFSLRGPYVGMMGGFYALGSIVGLVVGGALAQVYYWRFIFWTYILVTSACAILVPLLITLAPTSGAMSQKLRRIDWVGNVLFTLSMTSFLVPVTWGGV